MEGSAHWLQKVSGEMSSLCMPVGFSSAAGESLVYVCIPALGWEQECDMTTRTHQPKLGTRGVSQLLLLIDFS